MFHRIELVMALLTGAVTAAGAAFAVFGPATYSYGTNWMSAASMSLWDQGLESGVVLYLGAMLLAGLAVTAGVYLRAGNTGPVGTTVLWTAFLGLFLGGLITLPGGDTAFVPSALHTGSADSVGIGIYFIPAALLAFVTAIVSMVVHHTPGRPVALRPH